MRGTLLYLQSCAIPYSAVRGHTGRVVHVRVINWTQYLSVMPRDAPTHRARGVGRPGDPAISNKNFTTAVTVCRVSVIESSLSTTAVRIQAARSPRATVFRCALYLATLLVAGALCASPCGIYHTPCARRNMCWSQL